MAFSEHRHLIKKVSFTAYLFFYLSLHAFSNPIDWHFNEKEKEAYKYIISLQPDLAAPLLQEDRPASLYLKNLSETLRIIITEDKALFDKYEAGVNLRISSINDLRSDSPYKNFYLGEMYLQKAFVNLKFGNDWTAAWDFRSAYKLIMKNEDHQNEKFIPKYKSLGLLNVMIGSVPERHHWILNLLGMNGSIQQGLEEIKMVSESGGVFKDEAQAIYLLLQAYLLNQTEKAVTDFSLLYKSNDENLLFGYLYMSLLVKNSQSQQALEVFHQLDKLDDTYLIFNFLNYMAGEIYLQKGEYALAETYFNKFLSDSEGLNFVKDSYYKLFLIYWLSDQENKALAMHKKAQSAGVTIVEADKHAAKNLKQTEFPNKIIMKLRLLTDGGFYDEAEKLLLIPITVNSKKERVEFTYRKARLFHKTGKLKNAIALYQETIDASAGENWYFAPNACLQVGYIYQNNNDPSRAQHYFNRVLSYKNHEYKNSLDNKAKAALASFE